MKIDFLKVVIMDDMEQLEIDNLRHEIEGLVGVFSVEQIAAQQGVQRTACPHTHQTGVGKWTICVKCGERV